MIFSDAAWFQVAKPEVTQEEVLHSLKPKGILKKKHGFEIWKGVSFQLLFFVGVHVSFSGEYLPGN